MDMAAALVDGDRRALSRAITLVESTRDDHRTTAQALLEEVLPHTGKATRIGVTGAPGVGKSTFIDAFGSMLVAKGRRVAVLAVDPSSTETGGSILGDKTRMTTLATNPAVYIRPSPTAGHLGGIGRRTRDAVLFCEAAGYDPVIVETVGVGQSETTVDKVTDLFLLLVAPGGGDDLQGIKRGIMELADLVVVNKADGPTRDLAASTAADYRRAVHLLRPKHPGVETPVLTCSSTEPQGIDTVWHELSSLRETLLTSGAIRMQRRSQAVDQFEQEFRDSLYQRAAERDGFAAIHADLVEQVTEDRLSVTAASRQLIDRLWPSNS